MRSALTFILCLFCAMIYAQNDTATSDSTSVLTAPIKFAKRDSTCFINVCRNDTTWLYDWQYDSTICYRSRGGSMTVWGTGPAADTLIHFEKADSFPSDFRGWLHDWMIEHRHCSYNMIYYNTGELHMIFRDHGEGHMGEFREYHKNGKLKCAGSYCPEQLAVRFGVWKWYDESGILIRTKTYKGDKYCTGEKDKYRRIYPFWLTHDYFGSKN